MTWRLADLTMPISPGMLVNPDHFAPEISTYATLDSHGWEARRLVLDSHLGTHLDAPSHFVADTATVDQADLAVLIGEAQVIHLDRVTPGEAITAARLGAASSTGAGKVHPSSRANEVTARRRMAAPEVRLEEVSLDREHARRTARHWS